MTDGADAGRRALASSAPLRYATVLGARSPSVAHSNEFGYCSIIRAATYLGVHETVFNWRVLKPATIAAGLEVKKVPSPRFDYQLLYPLCIFEQCYPQYDFSGIQPEAVAARATKLLTGSVGALVSTAH